MLGGLLGVWGEAGRVAWSHKCVIREGTLGLRTPPASLVPPGTLDVAQKLHPRSVAYVMSVTMSSFLDISHRCSACVSTWQCHNLGLLMVRSTGRSPFASYLMPSLPAGTLSFASVPFSVSS